MSASESIRKDTGNRGRRMTTRTMVTLAVLTAIEIVLSRFCSISLWNMKIGLSFIPVALAAMLYGPLAGGLVGAVADLLGATLFPIGPYFPGFTLTAFLTGMVYGLFLYKKWSFPRMILAVAVNQLVLSLFLQTAWISFLYGSPYAGLLTVRIVQCAVLIPVQILILPVLEKIRAQGVFFPKG